MHNVFNAADDSYNAAAEALAIAAARSNRSRFGLRCTCADRAVLEQNAKLLGCSQSDLVRGFMHTPIELQRILLEAVDLERPPVLQVDNVTLMQGVNQIRRAGYNIDYTLHALNTLLAKPGLHEERKFELLRNAAENSMRAANDFAAIRDLFASLGRLPHIELNLHRSGRLR